MKELTFQLKYNPKMYFLNKIVLLCLTLGVVSAIDLEANTPTPTPVLLWSSESLMNKLPEVESPESVQTTVFHDKYLTPLVEGAKHSLVAFLQNKLHVDDFTKYADVYASDSAGGAFKNIKQLMDDNFSLEMPQVLQPHLALDKLKTSFAGKIHSISSLKELVPLQLSNGEQFLLIVNLNSLTNTIDEEKAISHNDELIGDVAKHLEKRGIKHNALFTGKTSVDSHIDEPEVHTGRHLLADSAVDNGTTDGVFMNVTNTGMSLYVFLKKAVVCVFPQKGKCGVLMNLIPTEKTADTSSTVNGTVSLVLSFPKVKANTSADVYDVTIESTLKKTVSKWMVLNTRLTMSGSNVSLDNAYVVAKGVDFSIPLLYSFHCTDLKMYVETLRNKNVSTTYAGSYVRLDGYQLQAFNIKQDRFLAAQDCVGFFTQGIWMGLVPTFLLLIILISGTMMLLSLSVTDRFDDPKRKTITVTASD